MMVHVYAWAVYCLYIIRVFSRPPFEEVVCQHHALFFYCSMRCDGAYIKTIIMYTHIKKVVLLLIVTMSMLSVSCSKDNNLILEGKTYACLYDWSWDIYNNRYIEYKVIRFSSPTEFEISTRYDSPVGPMIGSMYTGTYKLSYPNLTIEYTTTSTIGTTTEHTEEYVFLDYNTFRYTTESGKIHDYILQ